MKTRFLWLAIFFAVVLFGFENVKACVCNGDTVCEKLAFADSVFVGKVLDFSEKKLTKDDEAREMFKGDILQTSRLMITEAFFGTGKGSKVFIETNLSNKSGINLEKNKTYLIYATENKETKKFESYCCNVILIESADKSDLAYLRKFANSQSSATVSGFVAYSPNGFEVSEANLISKSSYQNLLEFGVTTLTLTNENYQFQAKIQSDGTYLFENIPKGKYVLKPLLPDSLTDYSCFNSSILERNIEVDFERGCLVEDFTLVDNGRIIGKIVDSNGNPVSNISVSVSPVNKTIRNIFDQSDLFCNWERTFTTKTDSTGNYSIFGLPEGKYFAGIRLNSLIQADSIEAAYPKVYFPNAENTESAKIVTVQKGKQTSNVNIKLFPKFKEKLIKGRVVWSDGTPISEVLVRYVARTPDLKHTGLQDIYTDKNGYFSFVGYENNDYLINAEARNKSNTRWIIVQREILQGTENKELEFVINETGDNCPNCKNLSTYPLKPKN